MGVWNIRGLIIKQKVSITHLKTACLDQPHEVKHFHTHAHERTWTRTVLVVPMLQGFI